MIKVATFNINGIKARLPRLIEWLEETRPSVACLQEIKTQDEGFPIKDFEAIGYKAIWHGQKGFNGVAILADGQQPVEICRGLEGEPEDEHSRYIEADVFGIRVACIYLPNGNPQPGPKFDYKLRWMQRLADHARGLVGQPHPVAILGDFNVIPTDDDVYDPKAWRKDALIQPQVREAYARLLAQGWTDALRHLHPEQAPYTFWDYFRQHAQRDRGLRIDHLLLNPVLAAGLRRAGVDRWVRLQEKASDHAPAWVEVSLPRA